MGAAANPTGAVDGWTVAPVASGSLQPDVKTGLWNTSPTVADLNLGAGGMYIYPCIYVDYQ